MKSRMQAISSSEAIEVGGGGIAMKPLLTGPAAPGAVPPPTTTPLSLIQLIWAELHPGGSNSVYVPLLYMKPFHVVPSEPVPLPATAPV